MSRITKEEIEKTKCGRFLLSDENIYLSIYSLNSYVFEYNLLNTEDRILYHRLQDKFDARLINGVITRVREQIIVPKSFISKMDPGRILTLIEQSNTENIEAFRYAINDLYSFSNISDFYMEDYENLKTIYEGIKPDDQQYDLIKKKNVELLKVIIGRKMELLRPKSIDGN